MATIKSIEQKAQRYDEALEKLRSLHDNYDTVSTLIGIKEELENIFPELKESEDEMIIERIKKAVESYWSDEPLDEILAWLEKQGEQNPANNKGMNIDEDSMTPFQKKVFCIIDTAIEEERGLKQVCDELLSLAHDEIMWKPAWSEEDEFVLKDAITAVDLMLTSKFQESNPNLYKSFEVAKHWLKSLKDRYTWKPSDNELEVLRLAAEKDGTCLMGLYEQLKKLK